MLRHVRRESFVLGKKKIQRLAIEFACLVVGTEVWDVVAALLEILIACGALLPIPALLVSQLNCCQNREPLDRQRNMRQVGNRAVAILKVKSIEKLLRLLRADLAQR